MKYSENNLNAPERSPALSFLAENKISIGISLLVVVPLLSWIICFMILESRFDSMNCEIRKTGQPTTLAELDKWYPEVPASENAANVYQMAFGKYFENIDNKLILACGLAEYPSLGDPIPEDVFNASNEFLEKNREAIALLHRAAEMEKCRFNVDLKLGLGTLLPHLSPLRQGARLLSLESLLSAEKGDSKTAFDATISGLKLPTSLKNEPVLISYLVSIACEAIVFSSLETMLNKVKLSDSQLSELSKCIAESEQDNADSLERALYGERAWWNTTSSVDLLLLLGSSGSKPSHFEKLCAYLFFFSGLETFNKIKYSKRIDELIGIARKPYEKSSLDAFDTKLKNLSAYYYFVRIGLASLTRVSVKKANMEATIQTAIAGLAVERYRLKHDKLPESLDDLVPDFLSEVPVDPFDGKELRYRKGTVKLERPIPGGNSTSGPFEIIDKNGYVVYSIGANGIDDGGISSKSDKGLKNGDITFTVTK